MLVACAAWRAEVFGRDVANTKALHENLFHTAHLTSAVVLEVRSRCPECQAVHAEVSSSKWSSVIKWELISTAVFGENCRP